MRTAAAAVVGTLIAGGGLGAAASGSAVEADRQTPAHQVTVLKVEGMT